MDYQKLEYFINAAYYQNFSKAAEASHVTQATISRQIQSLEEEIGTSLFYRSKQGVELTPAGTYLFHTASSFMEQHHDIISGCRKAADSNRFRIRLATGPYEHLLIQEPLSRFLSRYPDSELNLMTYTYKILASRFCNHSIDFGFCTEDCAKSSGGLIYTPIYNKPWQVVAHKDNPFWNLPRLQQRTLQNQKIVTLYRNNYEPVEAYCRAHNLHPSEFIETNFLNTQILLLRIRSAIAIMPPFVKPALPADMRMEDILEESLCPVIVAAYTTMIQNQGGKKLAEICTESFRNLL